MNKIVTVLIAGLLLLTSAMYSQTSFSINPSVINGNVGETVTVEVIVNGFTDIVSMQYALKWDPAVIKFASVGDFNLDFLLASNFNVNTANTDLGILPLSWFDNNTVGITVADGTAIFSVSFVVQEGNNSGSTITFSEATNLIIEITDANGDITNTVTFNDGQFGDPNNNGGGNTTPLISSISSGSGASGGTVCLNVSVSNFTDITEMQYSLNWNPAVLQFAEIRNMNLTGLTQASFETTQTANGQLSVDWSNASGHSVANGTIIYQVCFNLIGEGGTSSAVSFSSSPTPISVTTTASATSVGISGSNGTIGVTGGSSSTDFRLLASAETGNSGETVCVQISTQNFTDIVSMQYSMNWNSAVLQFDTILGANLNGLSFGSFNGAVPGELRFTWDDPLAQGITLADNTVIYEVCFTIVGSGGSSTNINFTNSPTPIEIIDGTNNEVPFNSTAGAVTVLSGTGTSTDFRLIGSTETAEAGETVCVQVSTQNFDDIISMQYSMNWNPAVLQYDTILGINLNGLSVGNFNPSVAGELRFTWDDPLAQGITLADNTVIYEVCFVAVGSAGNSSTVSFSSSPTPIEIIDGASNEVPFFSTAGLVTVVSGGDGGGPDSSAVFNVADTTAVPGSNICVPVTLTNFTNILGFQFSMNWDPMVIQFDTIMNFGLDGLTGGNFNTVVPDDGTLRATWTDPLGTGASVSDGTIAFEICFDVIGADGTSSNLAFTNTPIAQELVDNSGTIDFLANDGSITVNNDVIIPPIELTVMFSDASVTTGESVCLPVTVNGFTNIEGMQYSMNWDPAVLQYDTVRGFNLTGLTAASFNNSDPGALRLLWQDPNAQGISIDDGVAIYEVCFIAVGAGGTSTDIGFFGYTSSH